MNSILSTEQMQIISRSELIEWLRASEGIPSPELLNNACQARNAVYGDRVFIRGLIEISNICRNDCFYCGLRCSNQQVKRYRMSAEQIMTACQLGYDWGFRTFVLQGGEDPYFDDQRLSDIIHRIKDSYPDCAVTLSLGERSYESYLKLYQAGADRYLLRHESANKALYQSLHPVAMRLEERIQCLWDLKKIGFQVGAGLMVDSPGQTLECLADDLVFLRALQPQMVGIGPFIPHDDTPLAGNQTGRAGMTILMLALTRLLLPSVLLPVTTALTLLNEEARIKGLQAGGNVIMLSLTPDDLQQHYRLYNRPDGKAISDKINKAEQDIRAAGMRADFSRGDYQEWVRTIYPMDRPGGTPSSHKPSTHVVTGD